MIDSGLWTQFRDHLRDTRLKGQRIKYIGKKFSVPVYVTGVPVIGNKIYINEGVLTEKDFTCRRHMLTSFSVNGELLINSFGE